MSPETTPNETAASAAPGFPSSTGEMAELIRRIDWSKTPLGPIDSWPLSLRTIIGIMLAQRFPMLLWWGPEYVQLYNDAYLPIPGTKHPRSMGQRGSECWAEIWHILQPLVDTPFRGGPATWIEDIQLEVNRHGFLEETHFTIAYSPAPDESAPHGVGGVLATVHEITEKVIGERRVVILRDLGARALDAKTAEQACAFAAKTLGEHPQDFPFALIYLIDSDSGCARLAGTAGVAPGEDVSPAELPLEVGSSTHALWPFAEAVQTGSIFVVENLAARFRNVPPGPWSDPPDSAVVAPIPSPLAHHAAGIAVFGVSARLRLGDSYRGFLELVTSQIAAGVSNARAYEQERKRAEALTELDQAKTLFFSNVSHEFRTPLTLLLGPLQELLSKDAQRRPEEEREVLTVAYRNGLRLQKLVNTLLDFSRLEAGRLRAVYEPVDLASLTIDLASNFRPVIERAGLTLAVDCPPLPEPVYVDKDMWEKVVLNFLSNAFKFTLHGVITVALKAVGRSAELSVRDTGTGIPPDDLPRIFERFYRVEGAKARTIEGTGIGLSLVAELVKLHGGAVRVESEVGKGSRFTASIPFGSDHLPDGQIGGRRLVGSTALRSDAYMEEALRWLPDSSALPGDASLSQSDARSGAKEGRVLLVDDNADMRGYLKRILGERFDVRTASNAEEALGSMLESAPDLVVSDIMMPGMDGFALLREIRSRDRTRMLPVILLSARAGEEAKIEGIATGADDYLTKPFTARELLARVAARIELASVRRKAAEALQESAARFHRLFEANIFGVAFTTVDGRIVEANEAFLGLVGYSRQDLSNSGLQLDRISPPEFQDLDSRAFEELRARGACTPYEKDYLRKDGTRVPVLIGAAFLEEPYDVQDSAVIFCLDLTERKQLDDHLRQSQKLESLGVLAGGVAHDFNNLLVGILGNASLALESSSLSKSNRERLEDVVRASERAADLTKQLLAYAGKGRLRVAAIDLSALIRETATLIHASIPKNVRLRLDLPDGLPRVEGDASQIQQIVMNLIINGAEAMGDRVGAVRVATGVQFVDERLLRTTYSSGGIVAGQYVYLEVQDTGCGMAEETLAKIFDPFFTTKFLGRGLGLAAAQGIVRGHKGVIQVSSFPERGTTFKVLLPAHENRPSADEAPVPEKDLTGAGFVLVVDDEEIVRRMAKSALQWYGYSVLLAENGREAVDIFDNAHESVVAIVLDMTMQMMDGEEALRHFKRISPDTKVILSSGFNEAEAIRRFAGKGLAGFIQKPYTSKALAEKIKEVRTNPLSL